MDRLVHNFRDDAPDYVRQYRRARIIVDSGRRHDKDDNKGGNNDNTAAD